MASDPIAPVRLLATLRDVNTGEHFVEIDFETVENERRKIVLPSQECADYKAVLRALLREGYQTQSGKGADLKCIGDAVIAGTSTILVVSTRAGWHGESFVLPHQTLGAEDGPRFLRSVAQAQLHAGTLEAWQSGLKAACGASSYITFATALSCAAALLKPLDMQEGVIFQFTGRSSTGKTSAALIAQSASCRATLDTLLTHDVTGRALEERASAANDGLLVIDETQRVRGSQAKKREHIAHLPYALASGRGRVRSKSVSGTLDNVHFRIVGLSTGEMPLASYGERELGEIPRFIDIPVPPPDANGVLDRLDDDDDPKSIMQAAEACIQANYGVATEAFLEHFVADYAGNSTKAKEHFDSFLALICPDGSSLEQRLAGKFAVVYAAAALGSEFGVFPFTATHAKKCIRRLYCKARTEARTAEEAKITFLETLAKKARSTRFPRIKKGESLREDLQDKAYGFRRDMNGEMSVAIASAKIEQLVEPRRHAKAVVELLAAEGKFVPGHDGRNVNQIQVRGFPNPRGCFYVLPLSRLPQASTPEPIPKRERAKIRPEAKPKNKALASPPQRRARGS